MLHHVYKLNNVIISGNKYLDDSIISTYFNSQLGKHYNPTFIRKQLIALKRTYLKHGKLDIHIMDELLIDGTNITLRVNISEGVSYIIKGIDISLALN